MGRKSIITFFVTVGCMAFFLIISGCIGGSAYWDGWVGREVVVTVLDENTTNPISGATVTLEDLHLPKNPGKELKVNAITGPDGIARLFALFAGGGERYLFLSDHGHFGLWGTLKVTTDEYATLTETLSSLVGKRRISTGDKSAINVRVYLTRKE